MWLEFFYIAKIQTLAANWKSKRNNLMKISLIQKVLPYLSITLSCLLFFDKYVFFPLCKNAVILKKQANKQTHIQTKHFYYKQTNTHTKLQKYGRKTTNKKSKQKKRNKKNKVTKKQNFTLFQGTAILHAFFEHIVPICAYKPRKSETICYKYRSL